MDILVGYTGFVGSNILQSRSFDHVFNSKNIEYSYGTKPELLVYAGMSGTKFLANLNPIEDEKLVMQAQKNIKEISPKKIVLISTVDVFKSPINVDEFSKVEVQGLNTYGYNRYMLELWVRDNFKDALIIRLPAIYGNNIKKNFIFDYIMRFPPLIEFEEFKLFCKIEPKIVNYYTNLNNGFYQCNLLNDVERKELKEVFSKLNFTPLRFTDSRSAYQFYPLSRLWDDIQIAIDNELTLVHCATEPISAGELYSYLSGESFINYLNEEPSNYNYVTAYAKLFGGVSDYMMTKKDVLIDINRFVANY